MKEFKTIKKEAQRQHYDANLGAIKACEEAIEEITTDPEGYLKRAQETYIRKKKQRMKN